MFVLRFWWPMVILSCSTALIEIPDDYLNAIRQDRAEDDAAGDYNYDHQGADWTGICDSGQRQSPIDLIFSDSTLSSIPRIRFHNYNQSLRTPLVLTNNGHTANMVLPLTRGGQRPYINGGLLPGDFEVQSVHFHWGSRSSKGSEHAINYVRYDVEMHIVHKNRRYQSMGEATQQPDGLAVLGVMFRAVPRSRPNSQLYGLNKIFNQVPRIVEYNSNVTISGQLNVGQLLGDVVTGEFYSYNGSLTTPDCAESVTWTVFSDILDFPERQIAKLWTLKDSRSRPLINNYRDIQDTNGRPVYYRALQKL
ncbi:putative carbonic anhydrase 3 [Drosophila tropicalis]|uniref:putative carbonic anhydrase 3 n=1 Tax=Drosophila tropicalis TaxID=46794 RepID=UPI0035ABBB9F